MSISKCENCRMDDSMKLVTATGGCWPCCERGCSIPSAYPEAFNTIVRGAAAATAAAGPCGLRAAVHPQHAGRRARCLHRRHRGVRLPFAAFEFCLPVISGHNACTDAPQIDIPPADALPCTCKHVLVVLTQGHIGNVYRQHALETISQLPRRGLARSCCAPLHSCQQMLPAALVCRPQGAT
jgi:hypothetical protein